MNSYRMWCMKVLPKDFLSIEDVANYFEKIGYGYDLQMQYEYQRLFSDIYDLINQRKITAVFHHYGRLQKEVEYFEMDEDDRGRPIKITLHEEQYTINADDYFCIEREYLKDLLLNENEVNIDRFVDKYGETTSTSQDENIYYRVSESIKISIRDIRIPRCELDNLFQENLSTSTTNNQTVNSNHRLLDDEIPSRANEIGKHKVLQGNPKTDKQIIDESREQIVQLTTENEKLKSQPEQQINIQADDEPTHHKTINSMATLIATLLKLASYDKQDLGNPHGTINKEIIAKAEGLGLTLGKDFIAKWLNKADEVL